MTYYVEWVLGTTRQTHQPAIVPAFDPESETLTATNPWNDDFGTHVAFVAAGKRLHGYTADRGEFLGRNGDRARPAALGRIGLANTVRPGADPCAALQVHIDLPPGATRTVHFMLGQDTTQAAALELVRRYRDPSTVAAAWEAMRSRWETLLAARVVQSPDRGLDLMLNRWLPYQTLSARCWGRTGFYQSSGAFGFRDQLQDVAALVPLAPELCRKHSVESAAHQFEEGDVLHWWHPQQARIRTRVTICLLPPSPRTTRNDRRQRGALRQCAVSDRPRRRPGAERYDATRPARVQTPCTITACARSKRPARSVRTRCRSSAAATGTTA